MFDERQCTCAQRKPAGEGAHEEIFAIRSSPCLHDNGLPTPSLSSNDMQRLFPAFFWCLWILTGCAGRPLARVEGESGVALNTSGHGLLTDIAWQRYAFTALPLDLAVLVKALARLSRAVSEAVAWVPNKTGALIRRLPTEAQSDLAKRAFHLHPGSKVVDQASHRAVPVSPTSPAVVAAAAAPTVAATFQALSAPSRSITVDSTVCRRRLHQKGRRKWLPAKALRPSLGRINSRTKGKAKLSSRRTILRPRQVTNPVPARIALRVGRHILQPAQAALSITEGVEQKQGLLL